MTVTADALDLLAGDPPSYPHPIGRWLSWVACEQPERLPDKDMCFHVGCSSCFIAATALMRLGGAPDGSWHNLTTEDVERISP